MNDHTCDRKGPPAKAIDESRDEPITGIYPTCSVCGQVLFVGTRTSKARTVLPAAEREKLERNLEAALGMFGRAQDEFEAAVKAHEQTRMLLAELADTRARLALATKAYREAALDFMAANEPVEQVPGNSDRTSQIQ